MRVSHLGGRNCEVLACIWFGLVMCVWVMYLVCFCNAFVRMRISHLSVLYTILLPSARMRSEGRPVCVSVSVCPGLASATHATTRPSRHTYGLSIVFASV